MKALLLAALSGLIAVPFIFAGNPSAAQPKAAQTNSPPAATLGFLETRHHSIEIKAGDNGTYTVRSKDGKVLARDISASQLQARFPELQHVVRSVAWDVDAGS
jgi:hypothetical protein